ncbi:hypothetical protein LCGC14_0983590 [marine sediment metagenome]|uniref:Scaffolding protein n=1 Tax=marine sediment metagenome TaxID=412755 RepID=A0A0F9NU85_9ZZZZ
MEVNKDALPGTPGQPSTPQTFTEEQVAARHSKLDTQIGQQGKTIERNNVELTRLKETIKRQDDETRELVQGQPDALATLEARRKLERTNEELRDALAAGETKEAELAALRQQVGGTERERTAAALGTELKVDPKQLLQFGGATEETMRELAGSLRTTDGSPPLQGTPPPDPGTSSGGGGAFTVEQIQGMSSEEYAKNKAAIQEAQRGDRIRQ